MTNYLLYGKTILASVITAIKFLAAQRIYAGYDLKQIFIGAEGTLGVITGVSILCAAAPQASNLVVLSLPEFKNVPPLYKRAKRHLSEVLSAFEYFDRDAYNLVVKHNQGRALSNEDIENANCFVLVETSGSNREHDEEVCLFGTLLHYRLKQPNRS